MKLLKLLELRKTTNFAYECKIVGVAPCAEKANMDCWECRSPFNCIEWD